MSYKKRVDTLRVVMSGSPYIQNSSRRNAIISEVNRIHSTSRLAKHNGWLLAVLHTTRALDTALAEIVAARGLTPQVVSLGGYLVALVGGGIITPTERNEYQNDLVKKRNKYMHEAGAMPDQIEVNAVLSKMHACIVLILARI